MSNMTDKERKILLKDLNDVLTCNLCEGYFIDATTLVDCLHTFCRGCILRYFENSKTLCPKCNTVYKKRTPCFRPDIQIQTLVYKLVPSLYTKEMQRRDDFYRSTGLRASSSCSDDSVLERERDTLVEEEMISTYCGDPSEQQQHFFSPEDPLSLSLEYYQQHLDNSDKNDSSDNKINSDSECSAKRDLDKKYFLCPASVTMKHLQKLVRMKYGLTSDHRVDIIFKGEVLTSNFSLMDVAYTFKWQRKKPIRFFYRIFTPMKVQPIKIVNTTLSTGCKQLQIVPVKPTNDSSCTNNVNNSCNNVLNNDKKESEVESNESNEKINTDIQNSDEQQIEKEKLLAHLQLQVKTKVPALKTNEIVHKEQQNVLKSCIFDYETQDPDAIKRFAEKRDLEWALQKEIEEKNGSISEEKYQHHFSKKRKKNKHNKNEFNPHKKRKLHAEITSNEKEDLKLKVKITNGHKHKHHKSNESNEKNSGSSSNSSGNNSNNVNINNSNKEKLLMMRQIRHKNQSEEIVTNKVDKSHKNNKFVVKFPKVENNDINNSNNTQRGLKMCFNKTSLINDNKWIGNTTSKIPTVQLERNEQTERQAQAQRSIKLNLPQNANQNNKIFERKINNDITSKNNKVQIFQNPPGFTVSKVETGLKRKNVDAEKIQDKRPSLEITLIQPSSATKVVQHSENISKNIVQKRPLPATIPLERIKKSVTNSLKNNTSLSIIPSKSDTTTVVPLDLSKSTSKTVEKDTNNTHNTVEKLGLSNLQMLSKVATEHSSLNKQILSNIPKQMPSLQTITSTVRVPPNLQRMAPPKLNEIPRQFPRTSSVQIRNLRPNQNQNIRNIPNPSLLVNRQQNQRFVGPGSNGNVSQGQGNNNNNKGGSGGNSNNSKGSQNEGNNKEMGQKLVGPILEGKEVEKKEVKV